MGAIYGPSEAERAAWIISEAIDEEDLVVELIQASDLWTEDGGHQAPLSLDQARRAVDVLLIKLADLIRAGAA